MSELRLILPSFGKINWFLKVLGKREDDYHEIFTVFQTVSLHDLITFEKSDREIKLICDNPHLPTGEENLILKAARLLAAYFDVKKGATIQLEKRVPFPGGLGGGSSNAAIALLGLSTLWDLPVKHSELMEMGSRIGADVPFFLVGGTAIGRGIGTEVSRLPEIEEKFMIIVASNVDIPTKKAYAKLNALRLTKKVVKSILHNCYDDAERLESRQLELFNDFEKAVFQMKPEIARVKHKLLKEGAKKALMSGSGASVFAVFDNEKARQAALESFSGETQVEKFAVETISRREYRMFLEPCKHLLPESF